MSDLDIQYQDYKNLMPAAFHSRYKISKDEWIAKNKNIISPPKVKQTRAPAKQNVKAYGQIYDRNDRRVMWNKTFTSTEAAHKWAERNNATVMGVEPLGK